MNLAEVTQGSLGLPEPNYYSDTDERTATIRAEYEKYVAKIFTLLGDAPGAAAAKARNVLRLERDLAAASLTRVQRRDIEAQYNPRPFTDLATVTPSIDWTRYVRAVDAPQFDRINVAHPKYYAELDRQLKTTPIAEWRDYLRFRITDAMAPYLSKAFDDAEFEFRGRTLSGRKQQHPRERRCVSWTDDLLGEPLGQVYAERHFTPATKARALEMIENLRTALRSNIGTVGWMDPKTKEQGLRKLDAIALKIGYPEKWIDYSSVTTDRTSFAGNVLRAQSFLARRPIEKIGKPVDKSEWQMSTPTVNAYNNPVWNEIVFSAGILQPPFYDPLADDAYNYGGMGAVIGHEMIHDFDDQGRLFDASGSMSDWWTSTDAKEFEKRAQCVADQFSSFELGNGLKMDGKLVLGESIADLGGLKIAYAAYQKSLEGKPRQIIDGFTPEQRFFLGWARIWSDNATREAIELQAKTDPHPISEYRVNGPLSNLPEFAAAFGCPATKPMVRADDKRCGVW
jgi:putative endopeptidase